MRISYKHKLIIRALIISLHHCNSKLTFFLWYCWLTPYQLSCKGLSVDNQLLTSNDWWNFQLQIYEINSFLANNEHNMPFYKGIALLWQCILCASPVGLLKGFKVVLSSCRTWNILHIELNLHVCHCPYTTGWSCLRWPVMQWLNPTTSVPVTACNYSCDEVTAT